MQRSSGRDKAVRPPWIWGLVVGLVVVAGAAALQGAALWGFMVVCAWAVGAALVRLSYVVRSLRSALAARDHVAAELQHREARWSSVVKNSTDMIVLLDAETNVKWASPVVRDMLGYAPEDFVDVDIFRLIHLDDYDVVSAAYAEALMKAEPRSIEVRLQHKDGSWRWFEIRAVSLLQDPNVRAVVISARDVTDRKRAEEALRASEERFRELAETVREVFYIHSVEGQLLYVSPAYETVWGMSRQSLYEDPLSWLDSIHPEDRAATESAWKSGTFQAPIEYRLVRPDGSIRWIHDETFPIEDPDGTIIRYVGIAEDVTERKLAERALVEQEEFERAILDSLSSHIAVLDGSGTIVSVNRAGGSYAQVTGSNASDIGINLLAVVRERAERTAGYELAMALEGLEAVLAGRREHFSIEYPIQAGGEESWFAMHVSPLRGERGGAVVSHLDVSERRRALHEQEALTEQLRQSQKLEAVGRLAGGVAHDFNNVLAVIQNYAWFLVEDMDPEDPNLQDVREILSAGERAGKLVQQLLMFSRKEIVKPEVLDVNLVIADYGKFLRTTIGEDISLDLNLDPEIQPVLLDSGHLGQILTNLAVNARDAMPDGGRLTIRSCNLTSPPDESDPTSTRDHILLEVSDTGCGMSEEVVEHLFEPFFTTKRRGEGTGLGLATVYGIVNQAGGRIDVRSAPDEGTTFAIHLPAAPVSHDPSGVAITRAQGAPGKETVLVVEDEDGVRRLVERILTTHGYSVLTADSGEEALRVVDEFEGDIDLLLTDVVMPGMSGRHLADEIARRRPKTKAIFMSGYTGEIIARRGRLAEGEVLIEKPFNAAQLLRTIRETLEATRV